jgi:hypothetical protein
LVPPDNEDTMPAVPVLEAQAARLLILRLLIFRIVPL